MIDAAGLLPRVKARLPGVTATDDLLKELIIGVIDTAKSATWRDELPEEMATLLVKWTVLEYNRLGIEGESAHSEGGVSRTIDIVPADIEKELTAWRQGKAGW